MKRIVLSLPVLLITFALGGALVPTPIAVTRQSVPPDEIVRQSEDLPSPVELPDQKSEFEPEFHDLPDFEGDGKYRIKLVDTSARDNAYRKSEVIAKNGERWLGMFEDDGKTFLRKVSTKVKFDPTYEGYGDEDYVRLTTGEPKLPLLLLKNGKRLKHGSVETYYLGPSSDEMDKRHLEPKEMSLGFKDEFQVGENWYTLRVAPGQTRSGEKVNVLVLEFDGRVEVVTYNMYYLSENTKYDTLGYLRWVGDLDRDGKLDLYLEHFGYEKGGFSSSLFLSSEATEGNMLKEAAQFGEAGC